MDGLWFYFWSQAVFPIFVMFFFQTSICLKKKNEPNHREELMILWNFREKKYQNMFNFKPFSCNGKAYLFTSSKIFFLWIWNTNIFLWIGVKHACMTNQIRKGILFFFNEQGSLKSGFKVSLYIPGGAQDLPMKWNYVFVNMMCAKIKKKMKNMTIVYCTR